MDRPLLVGNWKMHKDREEAVALASALRESLHDAPAEVVLCPPFTVLYPVAGIVKDSSLYLGAQNVHWQRAGAYTGEIAPGMLVDLGCRYVIVGHSERRQWFGETDEHVARKVKAALEAGLTPIVCVGENWEERQRGETEAKVTLQVRAATAWLAPEEMPRVVFAYEPLWAIGTGRNAEGADAAAVAARIREEIGKLTSAGTVRVLYGGSVKADNVAEFAAQPHLNGALVGGASLDAQQFTAIVQTWLAAEGDLARDAR